MQHAQQIPLPFEPHCEGLDVENHLDGIREVTKLTLAGSSPRALGAYYTPPLAAQLLAEWALRDRGDRILEPSMGDGVFLQALANVDRNRDLDARIWGVELAEDTFQSALSTGLLCRSRAIHDDFLAIDPFPVHAVVGNPPYIRLRNIDSKLSRRALIVADRVLGEPMDPSGSLWMPFVLHATEFLLPGGRIGLVLPYDLTYVRYARSLWQYLGAVFGGIRVIRVHERMFPTILQETVLLLADRFGEQTKDINFEAYDTVRQFGFGRPAIRRHIPIDTVINGKRAFVEALLPDDAISLLSRVQCGTVAASQRVTFNIGYVCGDKEFFHPSLERIREYRLPERSLQPALTASRQLRGIGLKSRSILPEQASRLFLPSYDRRSLTQGERQYIRLGEESGVADRYKCRTRDPWYVTPYVKVPDVVVPVFTERPGLILNDAHVAASNSLLCGYLKAGQNATDLAASWYTSLTLLQLELRVHALGGGVFVLVPRETGSLRLPTIQGVHAGHLRKVDALLRSDRMDEAFASGNDVLRSALSLSRGDVSLIETAAETLSYWRNAVRVAREKSSGEDVQEQQPALEGLDHSLEEGPDTEVAVGH